MVHSRYGASSSAAPREMRHMARIVNAIAAQRKRISTIAQRGDRAPKNTIDQRAFSTSYVANSRIAGAVSAPRSPALRVT